MLVNMMIYHHINTCRPSVKAVNLVIKTSVLLQLTNLIMCAKLITITDEFLINYIYYKTLNAFTASLTNKG